MRPWNIVRKNLERGVLAVTAGTLTALAGGCAFFGYELKPIGELPPSETTIFTSQDTARIYTQMVDDALSKPWVDDFVRTHNGQKPKIAVGTVATDRRSNIDTLGITKRVEEELINSQRVRVLADQEQVRLLVDQRLAQRDFTRSSELAEMANQLGIDFLMIGRVTSTVYRTEDERIANSFRVILELINLETAEKVWIQTTELTKEGDPEPTGRPLKWWAWWRAI